MGRSGLSRRDRRALVAVAAQFFVNGAVFASYVPRLPEIRDRVDVSLGALGAILALASLVGLVASATVGRLVTAFGTRRVMVTAAVGLTLGLAVVGLADRVVVLVLGLGLLGLLDVYVDATMNLQASWLSARRSAPVMNRLHGLWSLGTVLGGLAAAQVAELGVPLRTHLLVVAALMLAVVLVVGRNLLPVDERHEAAHDDEAEPGTTVGSGAGREGTGARAGGAEPALDGRAVGGGVGAAPVRRLPVGLVLLGLAGVCSIAMEQTSSDWAAFRLSDDFGARAGVAGLAYVAFTAGMTLGRFGGDTAIVRFGRREVFRAAIALTGLSLVVASFAPNRWVVVAAYAVAGLGIATQFPKLYDDAARHPGRTGAGLGALSAGSRLAMLVVPAAVGALASTRLPVGTATAAVTLPAAAGFVLVARRPARPPAPASIGA